MRAIYSGEKSSYEITVSSYQEQDGYFLCLKSQTSVTIAHIIITNVNKSEYVTIGIIPLHRLGVDATVPRLPYWVYYIVNVDTSILRRSSITFRYAVLNWDNKE